MSSHRPAMFTTDSTSEGTTGFQLQVSSIPLGVPAPSGPWALSAPEVWVGRGAECQVRLEDPSRQVSRVQAVLHWRDESWVFQQWGANPSRVNQQVLERGNECLLHAGDVIHMEPYALHLQHSQASPPPPIIPEHWNPFEPLSAQTKVHAFPMAGAGVDAFQDEPLRPSPWGSPLEGVFHAFLDGLGMDLNGPGVPYPDDADAARAWGRTLRVALEGLLPLVQAHQDSKQEVRSGSPDLPSNGNNPLNNCVSVDELLLRWVGHTSGQYLKPEQAVREACAEVLNQQQLSLLAFQELITQLAARLNPQRLRMKNGVHSALFNRTRYKILWQHYEEAYARTLGHAADLKGKVPLGGYRHLYQQVVRESDS